MNETIPEKAAHTVAMLPLIEEAQEKPKTSKVMSSTRACAKRLFYKV